MTDRELVGDSEGASEMHWRDFSQIHRRQNRVDAAIDAGNEPAGDEHLVTSGRHRGAHQRAGNQRQDVVADHGPAAAESIGQKAGHKSAD